MSAGLFDEPPSATPLDPDAARGLIPTWVATRGELNTVEQDNIGRAIAWASSPARPRSVESFMTEATMRDLHRRMFGDVWKWAGQYRQHDTNIGVHWPHIAVQVRDLVADVRVKVADATALPWPPDELAIRFHHRLVLIHPFPNGNGRHARLAADLLVASLGEPAFTWGARDLGVPGEARGAYLAALREADGSREYGPLVAFARS